MFLGYSALATGVARRQMTREQYEALAKKVAPGLKRAAVRLAFPDVALAEDLVQAALVRGYQLMLEGQFEPGTGAFSWFVRGVTCDFFAHRRKHGRCDVLPPESNVFVNQSAGETPESLLFEGMKSERLWSALEQLPVEQRACIELVDLAECSYVEAARILEVPVGTVRSRLSRARLFIAGRMVAAEETK
ncbi:MAG: sigma-70 family RNA polymerase sigma factor [Fimbriimonadaceae bacterium]